MADTNPAGQNLSAPLPAGQPPQNRNHRKRYLAALAAILVVAIGLGAYFIVGGQLFKGFIGYQVNEDLEECLTFPQNIYVNSEYEITIGDDCTVQLATDDGYAEFVYARFDYDPYDDGYTVELTGETNLDNPNIQWYIDDVQIGTGQILNHPFPAAGSYEVEMRVSGEVNGKPVDLVNSKTVVVEEPETEIPNSDFSCSQTAGTLDVECEADDAEGTHRWNFGTGILNDGQSTETHTYTAPGSYTITHEITKNDTSETASIEFTVVALPPAEPTLVAHWTFDEPSQSTFMDSTENNNDAEIEISLGEAVVYENGPVDKAANFETSKGIYAEVAHSEAGSLNLEGPFTAMVWVKTASPGILSNKYENATPDNGYFVQVMDNGNIELRTANANANYSLVTTDKNLLDNQWHHIAVVYGGSDQSVDAIYVDGGLVATGIGDFNARSTSLGVTSRPFLIGKHSGTIPTPATTFNGLLDDLRIYNGVMDADAINNIFGSGVIPAGTPTPAPALNAISAATPGAVAGIPPVTPAELEANFSITGQFNTASGKQVQFNNESTGDDIVAWILDCDHDDESEIPQTDAAINDDPQLFKFTGTPVLSCMYEYPTDGSTHEYGIALKVIDAAGNSDTDGLGDVISVAHPINATVICSPTSGQVPLAVACSYQTDESMDGSISSQLWRTEDSSGSQFYSTSEPQLNTTINQIDDYIIYLELHHDSTDAFIVYETPISVTAANPIVANASCSVNPDPISLNISCSAEGSTGSYDTISWNFGDDQTADEDIVTHLYYVSGDYEIVLTLTDGAETYTDSVNLGVYYDSPIITIPDEDQIFNTTAPRFEWTAVEGITYYTLSISGNTNFTRNNITATNFTIPEGVIGGEQEYNIMVAARDPNPPYNAYWSQQVNFSVAAIEEAPIPTEGQTVLLLPFDGDMVDSVYGNTMITHGVNTSDDDPKIGTHSAEFDGRGSTLSRTNPGDILTFGTEDFTIDYWVKFRNVNAATNNVIFWIGDQSNTAVVETRFYGGALQLYVNSNSNIQLSHNPVANTWEHHAIVRSGNNIKVFVDGNKIFDQDMSYAMRAGGMLAGNQLVISHPNAYFNGFIDEFHIVKGEAMWTENFTPPTGPYEVAIANDTWNSRIASMLKADVFHATTADLSLPANAITVQSDSTVKLITFDRPKENAVFVRFDDNQWDLDIKEAIEVGEGGDSPPVEPPPVEPKVELACEVSKNPLGDGDFEGWYSATVTAKVRGFDEETISHHWNPGADGSQSSNGLPQPFNAYIDPKIGVTTTWLAVEDNFEHSKQVQIDCKISKKGDKKDDEPPKLERDVKKEPKKEPKDEPKDKPKDEPQVPITITPKVVVGDIAPIVIPIETTIITKEITETVTIEGSGGGGGGGTNYPQCSDNQNNDDDNFIDFPADPGCNNADDNTESPDPITRIVTQCADGIDNDKNGLADYPEDNGCINENDNTEETKFEIIASVEGLPEAEIADTIIKANNCLSKTPQSKITKLEDIKVDNLHGEMIGNLQKLAYNGNPIIVGRQVKDKYHFEADKPILRSEFFKLAAWPSCLAQSASAKGLWDTKKGKKFKDVNEDFWGTEIIRGLANLNIVEGYKDGTIGPEKNITRAEILKLLLDAYALRVWMDERDDDDIDFATYDKEAILKEVFADSLAKYEKSPFPDISIIKKPWYGDYALIAHDLEITKGIENLFNGDELATRLEAATMVYNFFIANIKNQEAL